MIDSLLVSKHLSDYLSSLQPDLPEFLEGLYNQAREERVPVIRREAQSLLRFLVLDREPGRVLEIGTAIGFSSCFMAEFLPAGAVLDTVEKDDARFIAATANLNAFAVDYEKRYNRKAPDISPYHEDAEAFLARLSEDGAKYDLIFLDAAKAQYPVYLRYIEKLMTKRSILVTDNVLQEGTLAESKFTVTRRDRTIHLRMREFADVMFRSGRFDSILLPLGDGMTISRLSSKETQS
ncbi:MAG: class I SAM-dependent methyltransferase [Lachnospiraceae bacterium]|nr:class I SAM-dependent methyltransferase [Lachnospiraceae bacterium]